MTESEITELIGYINQRWPHSALEPHVFPVWVEDLAGLPREECASAVKRWAKAGEKFPPTSGWVFSEVERKSQAPVPNFDTVSDEIARALGRALAHELYRPTGHFSAEDTARAIEIMAEAGVHEAVLRFIQERGLREAWLIPHGDRYPLDIGQQTERRDLARHWRDVTVPGWRSDPSPGLALVRARAALGDGRRGELRAIDPSRHLSGGAS